MDGIIPELRFADKQKLLRHMRKCRDAGLKTRYLIIVNLFKRTPTQTAAALHIARSTVYRVAERFRQFGEWGLLDRREDNGEPKLSEYVLAELDRLVRDTSQDYGWPRPTWTRELLGATLRQRTGVPRRLDLPERGALQCRPEIRPYGTDQARTGSAPLSADPAGHAAVRAAVQGPHRSRTRQCPTEDLLGRRRWQYRRSTPLSRVPGRGAGRACRPGDAAGQ